MRALWEQRFFVGTLSCNLSRYDLGLGRNRSWVHGNAALLVVSWPKPRLGAKQVVGIYDNAFLYSVLPRWPMDNALMLVLPNCRRNLPQSESDWGRFSPTV